MPREKSPPGKLPPRKLSPRKLPPRKIAPRKIAPPEICPPPGKLPPKNCFASFSLLLTLSYSCTFLSSLTSFRDVSGTPPTSIMDPLVTLVNGINASILDVVRIVDLPLSLLKEVFQRYLSVKHTSSASDTW